MTVKLSINLEITWTTGVHSIANRRPQDVGTRIRLRPAAWLASWLLRPRADRPSCSPSPWGPDWDTRLGL